MKLLLVCGVGLISSLSLVNRLTAQVRPPGISGRAGAIVPQPPPALGGNYGSGARTHPLGGVPLPTFGNGGNRRRQAASAAVPYIPYIAPLYFSPYPYEAGYDYSAVSSQAPPPEGYGSAAPAQPVIINQYFGAPGPDEQARVSVPPAASDADANPGDPLGTPQSYYLIAYKDHTVYPALTYWLEGDTLHYVTARNTHNQASLALIDLALTTKLNADRSIPFSLPGK